MKFVTFLKIFGICLLSFVGVVGAGAGIVYGIRASQSDVPPESISFAYDTYNVDGDFTLTITTPTEDVSQTDVELDFNTTSPEVNRNPDQNGYITDGVISIPKHAKINEPIQVYLRKLLFRIALN